MVLVRLGIANEWCSHLGVVTSKHFLYRTQKVKDLNPTPKKPSIMQFWEFPGVLKSWCVVSMQSWHVLCQCPVRCERRVASRSHPGCWFSFCLVHKRTDLIRKTWVDSLVNRVHFFWWQRWTKKNHVIYWGPNVGMRVGAWHLGIILHILKTCIISTFMSSPRKSPWKKSMWSNILSRRLW